MGTQGIVAWQFAIKEVLEQQANGRGVAFTHVFHQVRDPIKVISSNHINNEHAWAHILKYCPECQDDNLTIQCAKFWVAWNKRAEEISNYRYKIEEFSDYFTEFCQLIGVEPDIGALETKNDKDIDSRVDWEKYKDITWDDLYSLNRSIADEVWDLAKSYGYSK
jgi:hypothetical protein